MDGVRVRVCVCLYATQRTGTGYSVLPLKDSMFLVTEILESQQQQKNSH